MRFVEDLLIKEVASALKPHGFAKNGLKFYLRQDNIGMIDIQKSRSNTADTCKFTINLGIYSPKLAAGLPYGRKVTNRPDSSNCHHGTRIGKLFGDHHDYWWCVDLLTNKQDVINDVLDKIANFAVPYVKDHMTDQALLNEWKTGKPHIWDIRKISTFLKVKGRTEEFEKYIEEIKQIKGDRKLELLIVEHLQDLAGF